MSWSSALKTNDNLLRETSIGHSGSRHLRNPELGVFDVRVDVDVDKLLSEPAGHQGAFQGTFDLHKQVHVQSDKQ